MFWPAASPVVKSKRRNASLLTLYCSISTSLPTRVVASARSLISAKRSSTQLPNLRAARALSSSNTGARCIRSAVTVAVTPPAAAASRMPRL